MAVLDDETRWATPPHVAKGHTSSRVDASTDGSHRGSMSSSSSFLASSSPPALVATTMGSGPPIVTLHSSGLSGRQFSRFAAEQKERATIYCPDLLGVGQTPLPAAPPFSLALEVDAVVGLLQTVATTHGRPARVFGHSWGGLVALEAAVRAPQLVGCLAVYEPVIVGLAARDGSAEAKAQVARIADIMQIPIDDDGGRRWVEAFVDWWNEPGFFARMPEAQRQQHVDTARQSWREASCVSQMTLSTTSLATLTVPTLFLVGETSPTSARESARIAAGAMPHAQLEVVTGAGHMGPLTHGPMVNGRVAAFFDEVSHTG
jgi:pimeloyl-ACP methyl ester carboxylesterase